MHHVGFIDGGGAVYTGFLLAGSVAVPLNLYSVFAGYRGIFEEIFLKGRLKFFLIKNNFGMDNCRQTGEAMIQFTTTILKFDKQGEKTGWTYIELPADIAQRIKPGNKKEFKVKGKLDNHSITRQSVLPMGGGIFIMPLNAALRKAIGKKQGAMLTIKLQEDKSDFVFNPDFMECLSDDPAAKKYFQSLPGSHQRYFSKWIDSAKTEPTRIKRISMAVNALSKKMGYGEMIRAAKSG